MLVDSNVTADSGGKVEGSTILLGLLEVILPTMPFIPYFCVASCFFHHCVCLKFQVPAKPRGEQIFGGEVEDLLNIAAFPGLPVLVWYFM